MYELLKFRRWALERHHYHTIEALDRYFMLLENRALDDRSVVKMKEQDIQGKILKKLAELGHYSINVIVASKGGVSDIISCSSTGQFWSIEVKKPGEEPRKLQYWNLEQVKKRGGIAFWCDSYDSFLVKYHDCAIIESNGSIASVD
jgi:hypothetical protein